MMNLESETDPNPVLRSLRLVRPAFVLIQLFLLAVAIAAGL